MMTFTSIQRGLLLTTALALLAVPCARAQVQIGGDFLVRSYMEQYSDTRDDRDDLTYTRYLGRLYAYSPLGEYGSFHSDFITTSENPVFPTRSIAGSGRMEFGISQIYGEMVTPNVPWADMSRFRIGRQHYELGEGLTLGDSYYMANGYDGLRADFARGPWTLGLLASVTNQEITEGGYLAKQGSDQLYVAKLEYGLYDHTLLAYSVYEKPRGVLNDNIVTGFGATGHLWTRDLEYFGEIATQSFNQPSGLPEKGGMAYMAGLSYQWSAGPFRVIKAEVRGAGYQGDDDGTEKIETFEPFYPSWFWGDRAGYVDGGIGGDYPHDDRSLEGSRVWYGRVYFSLASLPKYRLQFQYVSVDDWVNNDGITEPDDEYGVRLYYTVNENIQLQARYMMRRANSADGDVNGNGSISSYEDRHDVDRLMMEFRVQF